METIANEVYKLKDIFKCVASWKYFIRKFFQNFAQQVQQ